MAAPICDRNRYDLPWLPAESIVPDRLLPETGVFRWSAYRFEIRPFPGQTWWHAAFMAEIDGKKVCFSGDNYQPSTRWNGTGGFSSFNGSRFIEGFVASSKTILKWNPDLVLNGHNTQVRYAPSYYRKVISWAEKSEKATRALCPSDDLDQDYYLHPAK
mgnify:CR=1 FL=1